MRPTTLMLTSLLLAGVTPAIAQGTAEHAGMTHAGMAHAGMAAGGTAPSAEPSMMESMTKMNQAMSSAPMTGNADHDFVVMMIPHHQGAIDMANYELAHGKDPELRKLAHDIVAAQDKEIAFMKRWVDKHPAK